MRTIYKYQCEFLEEFALQLPKGATPLYFAEQNGTPYLWCEIENANTNREERFFGIFGTGNPLQILGCRIPVQYIGSYQSGVFVWHLYELHQ